MIQIKKIQAEETYNLRLKVLKTCEEYIYKYPNDFEKSTIHFAAFEDNENVGIVSLMENEHDYFSGKQVQLRGMAVLESVQGKGVGKELITTLIEESKLRKASVLWCNSRDYAVDFYKKQGFQIKGEKFFIQNVCDHYVMFLKL